MSYRVRFLNRNLLVICELTAQALSPEGVIARIAGVQWPIKANTLQILDQEGREIYRVAKGELK